MTPISLRSVVSVSRRVVASELDGELLIFDPDFQRYFSLNVVASRVWEVLKWPRPVSEIRDRLLEQFHVDERRCEADLLRLLQGLKERALIESTNESGP